LRVQSELEKAVALYLRETAAEVEIERIAARRAEAVHQLDETEFVEYVRRTSNPQFQSGSGK